MCTSHMKKLDLTMFEAGLTAEQEEDFERACRGQLGSTLHYNKERHVCFSDELLLLADPTFSRPRTLPSTRKPRGRPPTNPRPQAQAQAAAAAQTAEQPQEEIQDEEIQEENLTRNLEDLAAFFQGTSESEKSDG